MKRLLDFDPATGLKTWHDYDESEDRDILSYEQDCQPFLDHAHDLRSQAPARMGDFVHVAHIPNNVIFEWLTKYGVNYYDRNHQHRVDQLLDGEYKYLKTRDIILSSR